MCNQPREAMAVYRRMLEEGYSPNSTTYNALISAYGKAGQLDKVMEVFQVSGALRRAVHAVGVLNGTLCDAVGTTAPPLWVLPFGDVGCRRPLLRTPPTAGMYCRVVPAGDDVPRL